MVKPLTDHKETADRTESKYKGVRRRKWGKWVSEIRLPNSRQRIWLGSYDSPVKAARAFDAALFCLRGLSAKFNFPDNPPDIDGGKNMTSEEIQVAAAAYANSDHQINNDPRDSITCLSFSSSSEIEIQAESSSSPCPSVSDGLTHLDNETIPDIDMSLLESFSMMGPVSNSVADFGIFPGFDDLSNDYFMPPLPPNDYYNYLEENNCDPFYSQDSNLWNF